MPRDDKRNRSWQVVAAHQPAQRGQGSRGGWLGGGAPQQRPKTGPGSRGGPLPQSMAEKIITSAARSAATSIGRQVGTAILRGILGSMSGRR